MDNANQDIIEKEKNNFEALTSQIEELKNLLKHLS